MSRLPSKRRHNVRFPRVIGFVVMLICWLGAGSIYIASLKHPELYTGTPWGEIGWITAAGAFVYLLGLLSSVALSRLVRR